MAQILSRKGKNVEKSTFLAHKILTNGIKSTCWKVIIMPSFHISISGKLVQCVADPCKLHGGNDISASTKEEAETIYEERLKKIYENETNGLEKENSEKSYEAYSKTFDACTNLINEAKDEQTQDKFRTARATMKKNFESINGSNLENNDMGEIFTRVKSPDGGGTITKDGRQSPISGFCYSPYPEISQCYNSAEEFAPDQKTLQNNLIKFYNKNKSYFKDSSSFIGFWNDPETGKVYLDVSKVTDDAANARSECKQHDQIAFFDLQGYESVTVDPNAKSGQTD